VYLHSDINIYIYSVYAYHSSGAYCGITVDSVRQVAAPTTVIWYE